MCRLSITKCCTIFPTIKHFYALAYSYAWEAFYWKQCKWNKVKWTFCIWGKLCFAFIPVWETTSNGCDAQISLKSAMLDNFEDKSPLCVNLALRDLHTVWVSLVILGFLTQNFHHFQSTFSLTLGMILSKEDVWVLLLRSKGCVLTSWL